MEKSIITTGKTIELAISAAATQLNMDRDSFSVEVLKTASRGFLGIGATLAEIKVTYEVPDEQPKAALSSASRSKPKAKPVQPEQEQEVIKAAPATKPQKAVAAEAPKAKPEAPKAPKTKPEAPKTKPEAPKAKPEAKKSEASKAKKTPRPAKPAEQAAPAEKAPAEKAPAKVFAPAPAGSTEEKIEVFIKGLLEHMGSNAVPHASVDAEGNYQVELTGENLGMLIGRRGDTLDAIQHLTNYAINRGEDKRSRISVDAENYRGKREESLQHLAQKMASKAVRYRKNFTLEPMNAYERHVIHAALQDNPNVTTHSTGTEPNRRIVIAYARHKNAE